MIKELESLSAIASEPLSFMLLAINLAVGTVMSLVIRWHFQRYGTSLSNRQEFSEIFPFIVLTTLLVITVVKSSLALSLGLVGALSIVRFRTPIKEPEELAYLFLSIAVGLGLGANQTVVTVTAVSGILIVMSLIKNRKSGRTYNNVYLSISHEAPDVSLADVHGIVEKHFQGGNLRRAETDSGGSEIGYLIDVENMAAVTELTSELRETMKDVRVSLIDQSHLPRI
ncbi:MAG: DUF4956 domain-containing protein [Rhodospirillales bacterium]|nr:DUF4956 domain-containing protein [Rhodospirillales bacterium]